MSTFVRRTQLQRTFCEGLHGAPPAEPNTAFYTELDVSWRGAQGQGPAQGEVSIP